MVLGIDMWSRSSKGETVSFKGNLREKFSLLLRKIYEITTLDVMPQKALPIIQSAED